ncbi:putative 2-aminoethylphosphonate ABC transporter permease subunit [Rhodovastum atsumiense]|uniref:Putative 2-aminoethylphosphonate ABC transporter permease subunit n=1 Tax=Rhodovastum atsumiense TaxID=504468 RepID=A0A5M6IXQ8_9PROT|nr:putative 2-aminoethylphosphonate ABC transporter permease subunit [Rhodovastum atsumiense]KAA5612617.1 putative 2-aminoethylphosphonate ABC transporter permease subunit [Rhodovastum atsumiense]CAH2601282.1 putative 2-aminoethylphosphonate ABC transporter permease subunit [Rhodovastum atsumiense]
MSPSATVTTAPIAATPPTGRSEWSREKVVLAACLGLLVACLLVLVAAPLVSLLSKAFEDRSGAFVGLANFGAYFTNPALSQSIGNSLLISGLSTLITTLLAFLLAYGLSRTCMPGKGLIRAISTIPILAPSLLPAISLVYLFGNQGVIKDWLFGASIYGPIGIVIGMVFYTLPHATMILYTALSLADARLYEAAQVLGAGRVKTFFTVTLPGVRYGLVSAMLVVFTLAITDFGIPKVIGGRTNVLATDVYKQVVGQQNFQMGAVVGMVLLTPALLAFIADRIVQRRQTASLSARAVPYVPRPHRATDLAYFAICGVISLFLLGMLGMAAYGSFVRFWPYDLGLTLANYDFSSVDADGWASFLNSLKMASWTAVIGSLIVFTGAYLVEKGRGARWLRAGAHLLAMVPLAVPGLVLGISYIFFFNAPWNPLNVLVGSMAILVLSTVVHFYTVSHLTAVTALKQIDPEFESVSASLKVPFYTTFLRVTVPICLPTILDIALYLFVNAMTTVSAVVFLYSSDTRPAAVAVLAMDDAGSVAAAAAMAMMIVVTSAAVRLLQSVLSTALTRRTQAWRHR